MPVYEYRCFECGHTQDEIRAIADRTANAPECPHCELIMTPVIGPVRGVVKNPAVPKRNR